MSISIIKLTLQSSDCLKQSHTFPLNFQELWKTLRKIDNKLGSYNKHRTEGEQR